MITWQDTVSYVSVARNPILSVRFLGGLRAPVAPLLWKLTGTKMCFAVTQTVIGIVAWTVLAVTVAWFVRSPWRSLLAGVAVLVFASSWQVAMWDWSVLSESISVSAVALMFASVLWLARRVTRPRAAGFLVACLVYAAARDQGIWVVAAFALVTFGVAVARLIRRQSAVATQTALIGVALLAIAAVTEVGAASAHRNIINVESVFDVRVFPFPQRIAWFAAHGMPERAALDKLAKTTKPTKGAPTVISPDLQSHEWHALTLWFQHKSQTAYIEYLVTHPGYDLTALFVSPALTYDNANGHLSFYAGPTKPLAGLSKIMFPKGRIVVAEAILAAMLIVGKRRLRLAEVRALIMMGIVGLFSILTAWHGDGMEVARHTIEGNIQVRLAVLLALIFCLLWSPGNTVGTESA